MVRFSNNNVRISYPNPTLKLGTDLQLQFRVNTHLTLRAKSTQIECLCSTMNAKSLFRATLVSKKVDFLAESNKPIFERNITVFHLG